MPEKFPVIVLISGRGSNLQSLIKHADYFSLRLVASDNPQAAGLRFAEDCGIQTLTLDPGRYQSRKELKTAIFEAVREFSFELVALAGFMQIVPAEFVDEYYGRIVNIHPSLLPAYPGLDTHRRVLEAGERYHGCSVHYVDSQIDSGPLIAQARLECLSGESADELAARVLKLEHLLYPWVVNSIARGLIKLKAGRVLYCPPAPAEAAALGFVLPERNL